MGSKLLQLATIIICTVIIYIYFTSDLILYIHPRYLNFTLSFVVIGLVLLSIAFLKTTQYRVNKSGWIVVIVAFIALFLPPQSLSQQIAVSRENQSLYQNNSPDQTTYDSFSSDLTRFTVADWSRLLNSSPSSGQIVGKQASVEGFVFQNSSSQKFVARFQLTCCAVDATPLTIPLLESAISNNLPIGSWVSINGVMAQSNNQTYPFQLDIIESKQIPEPKEPYVY
jgi:putative membrane protein